MKNIRRITALILALIMVIQPAFTSLADHGLPVSVPVQAGRLTPSVADEPDTYSVTFDYGEAIVWEQNGDFYFIDASGNCCGLGTREDAEAQAQRYVVYQVAAGDALAQWPGYPGVPVSFAGTEKMMTGWQSGEEVLAFDEVYDYIPTEDITFEAQWSDFYTVTFDYGDEIVWEMGGRYNCVTEEGWHAIFESREEAEDYAAQTATLRVLAGDSLQCDIGYPPVAVFTGGTWKMMTGWQSTGDEPETLDLYSTYDYVPVGDTTFAAQWSDVYTVTFDYGEALVWEQDGEYCCLTEEGYCSSYEIREEAEENAVRTVTVRILPGDSLRRYLAYPQTAVCFGGTEKMMSGWQSTGDEPETLDLYSTYDYVPAGDITFEAQWSDVYTVTFDYGEALVWELGGRYNCVTEDGWGASFESREEAEDYAVQTVTLRVLAGDSLQRNMEYPPVAVCKGGTWKKMSGWQSTGDEPQTLELDSTNDYVPAGDITFEAQWSDVYTVTFDYGDEIVWEQDGEYYCLTERGGSVSYESREEAEENAVQTVTVRVLPGASLQYSPTIPQTAVCIGGTEKMMTGWQSTGDDPETFSQDSLYWYVPTGNTVFNAQWTDRFHTVTFDYGDELIWEKAGLYYYINKEGYAASSYMPEDAQAGAVRTLSFCVPEGESVNRWLAYPTDVVSVNGTDAMMTGWQSTDQENPETLVLGGTGSYVPTADVTFEAQWSSAFYTVTFDLGEAAVWEKNGWYYCLTEDGYMNSFSTEEIARGEAVRSASIHVISGNCLGRTMSYPDSVTEVGGTLKMMTGWRSTDGSVSLGCYDSYSYIPDRDITFEAQWSTDFYTLTFDYTDLLVWESDNMFCCIAKSGMWESYETEAEARSAAVQSLVCHVPAGETFNSIPFYPTVAVEIGGVRKVITGWRNDADHSEVYKTGMELVPGSDMSFTAAFADFHTVTFEYGYHEWISRYSGRWYIEEMEVPDVTCSVPDGERINCNLTTTQSGDGYYAWEDGTAYRMTGWRTEDGTVLAAGNFESGTGIYAYCPAKDETITAIWEEVSQISLFIDVEQLSDAGIDVGETYVPVFRAVTNTPAELVSWSVTGGENAVSITQDGRDCLVIGLSYGTAILRVSVSYGGNTKHRTVRVRVTKKDTPYTVRFHSNFGSPEVTKDETAVSGTVFALPDLSEEPGFFRDGYGIVGWAEDAASAQSTAGITYAINDTMDPVIREEDQVIDLYAVWSNVLEAEVSFDANGVKAYDMPSAFTVDCGIRVYLEKELYTSGYGSKTPSADGKVFGGWYLESGCVNSWDESDQIIYEDTVLYAKWTDRESLWIFDQDTGKYRYKDKNGEFVRDEWVLYGGYYYYFDADGYLVTDSLVQTKSSIYYVGADGKRQMNTWIRVTVDNDNDGWEWMYFRSNGTAYTGQTCFIDRRRFYFTYDGYAQFGFLNQGFMPAESPFDAAYYFGEKESRDGGYTGWIDSEGNETGSCQDTETAHYYFVNGVKQTSRTRTIGGVRYTFDENGVVTEIVRGDYTVTFDSNGHGTAPAPLTGILPMQLIEEPQAPEAAGYVFAGWYQDVSCTAQAKWDFSRNVVTENTVLYADWAKTAQNVEIDLKSDGTLEFSWDDEEELDQYGSIRIVITNSHTGTGSVVLGDSSFPEGSLYTGYQYSVNPSEVSTAGGRVTYPDHDSIRDTAFLSEEGDRIGAAVIYQRSAGPVLLTAEELESCSGTFEYTDAEGEKLDAPSGIRYASGTYSFELPADATGYYGALFGRREYSEETEFLTTFSGTNQGGRITLDADLFRDLMSHQEYDAEEYSIVIRATANLNTGRNSDFERSDWAKAAAPEGVTYPKQLTSWVDWEGMLHVQFANNKDYQEANRIYIGFAGESLTVMGQDLGEYGSGRFYQKEELTESGSDVTYEAFFPLGYLDSYEQSLKVGVLFADESYEESAYTWKDAMIYCCDPVWSTTRLQTPGNVVLNRGSLTFDSVPDALGYYYSVYERTSGSAGFTPVFANKVVSAQAGDTQTVAFEKRLNGSKEYYVVVKAVANQFDYANSYYYESGWIRPADAPVSEDFAEVENLEVTLRADGLLQVQWDSCEGTGMVYDARITYPDGSCVYSFDLQTSASDFRVVNGKAQFDDMMLAAALAQQGDSVTVDISCCEADVEQQLRMDNFESASGVYAEAVYTQNVFPEVSLETPGNIKIMDGVLTIDSAQDAIGYKLTVSDGKDTVTTVLYGYSIPELSLCDMFGAEIQTGDEYQIEIQAIANLNSRKHSYASVRVKADHEYTVTYILNGGTNSTSNPAKYTVCGETVTLKAPVRTGYAFRGWYLESTFATAVTQITKGSTGNKTFYAKWEKVKYTITYELGGGTNSTSNPTSYYVDTATITLKDPAKTGYTFKGWYKESTSGTKVTQVAKGSTGNIKLCAKWEKVKYTVTYELNGGKNSTSNPVSYYVDTATVTLKDPAKTGYTFKGWYKESTFKTKVTQIAKGSTGNIKLYAKWEKTKYTVTYVLDGGKNSTSNPASYYVDTATVTLKSPTKTNYVFKGWYKESTFKTKVTQIAKGSTGNVKLYAKWEKLSYTVTYVLNGGKNSSSNPASYPFDTATITLKSPTKTGYTFKGWYSDSKFKTQVKTIAKGSKGNKTFYAKWEKTRYTVSYELYGGKNNTSNPVSYYVDTKTITLKSPTRIGYTFKGWYKESTFKTKVTSIKKGSTGNVKLYAKWEANHYKIVFNANGGKGSMPAMTNRVCGKLCKLTANKFTRSGYTFAGWNTRKDGKGTTYKDKASATFLTTDDGMTVTLYAQWKKKK